jgi:hypothetical protein
MGQLSITQKLYTRACEKISPLRYIQRWSEVHNPLLFKRFNEVEASIQQRAGGHGRVDLSAVTIDCERLVAMLEQAVPYVDVPISDEALQSDPEFDVPDLPSDYTDHGILQWSFGIEVDEEWLEPDDTPEEIHALLVQESGILAPSL